MMRNFFLIVLVVTMFGCKSETNSTENKKVAVVEKSYNNNIKSYNYDGLKPLLHKEDNKTYVVNFWATWCAPCVKELPAFEELNANYTDKNVEVILVSLDFPDKIENKLIPFIAKRKLQSKVVVLDDDNQERWINEIDKNWEGDIPATLIYNKKKRKFYAEAFDYKELENELKTFLN